MVQDLVKEGFIKLGGKEVLVIFVNLCSDKKSISDVKVIDAQITKNWCANTLRELILELKSDEDASKLITGTLDLHFENVSPKYLKVKRAADDYEPGVRGIAGKLQSTRKSESVQCASLDMNRIVVSGNQLLLQQSQTRSNNLVTEV